MKQRTISEAGGLRTAGNPFGFFRVFDIAFLVPGLLVYIVPLLTSEELKIGAMRDNLAEVVPPSAKMVSETLFVVLFLGVIFTTGMVCHGIARLVRNHRHCWKYEGAGSTKDDEQASTKDDGQASTKDQETGHDCLSHPFGCYLWNLSTICWNTAVAVILGLILRWTLDLVSVILVLVSVLLVYQGTEFRSGCSHVRNGNATEEVLR